MFQSCVKLSSGNAKNDRHRWKTKKFATLFTFIFIEFFIHVACCTSMYLYNIAQILLFMFIIFYDVENVVKIRKICRIVQNMVFYISCEVYLMLFNGVSKKIRQ